MLKKSFALKLFNGFSIQRWNDMARSSELTEMDKAGLKMMTVYLLGQIESEKSKQDLNWELIIYAGFFDLLKRIALSDIKSSVHHRIRNLYPKEFEKLNLWVLKQYEDDLKIFDPELFDLFKIYLLDKTFLPQKEAEVLKAAHDYATYREFELIKRVNVPSSQLISIENDLNAELQRHTHLKGMGLLLTKQNLYELLLRLEQLRFQVRWSHTQRIPRTTVLGHSMLVASLAMLLTRSMPAFKKSGQKGKLVYSNFFAGLFHDLPESVIRDIVSPVKRATESLPEIVKEIEDAIVREELYPLMAEFDFKDELMAFTADEFSNRIFNSKEGCLIYDEMKSEDFILEIAENSKSGLPIMGRLVNICDEYAAFLEADQSIYHGISSAYLISASEKIKDNLIQLKDTCNLEIEKLFLEN
ncbi:MAG: HD domain-containing protein [Firmicutes bacterium]|nr:HD domain-containing protein [Bacillota bacterium]